jgi:hypothetical protein
MVIPIPEVKPRVTDSGIYSDQAAKAGQAEKN